MMKDVLLPDLAKAITEENFTEMADIYETIRNADVPDPFAIHFGFSKIDAEGVIHIPADVQSYIKHIADRFIYALGDDEIKFSAQDKEFDAEFQSLVFDYFEGESHEAKFVEVNDKIVLNSLAIETLELSENDIILFTIFDKCFEIKKFAHPVMRMLGK